MNETEAYYWSCRLILKKLMVVERCVIDKDVSLEMLKKSQLSMLTWVTINNVETLLPKITGFLIKDKLVRVSRPLRLMWQQQSMSFEINISQQFFSIKQLNYYILRCNEGLFQEMA